MSFLLVTALMLADNEHVTLGTRVGARSFYFDDLSPTGLSGHMLEADVGVRLGRHYQLYGFLEQGIYDERSDRIAPGPFATSGATGIGLRASTANEGAWDFVADFGAGYRWLRVPYDTGMSASPHGVDRFFGIEPLRARAGPSVRLERGLRVELMLGFAVGRFHGASHPETCSIVAACADSFLEDSDTQSATYFALDVSLGLLTSF